MYGITRAATARLPQRQYYECHGRDCILSARTAVCPSRAVKAEAIERAVWEHVAGLLAEPARLLDQFDCFAARRPVRRAISRQHNGCAHGWSGSHVPMRACSTPTKPRRSASRS